MEKRLWGVRLRTLGNFKFELTHFKCEVFLTFLRTNQSNNNANRTILSFGRRTEIAHKREAERFTSLPKEISKLAR